MGAHGHPPPSGGGAVGAKKDNCRGVENGKINSRSFCKKSFSKRPHIVARVCYDKSIRNPAGRKNLYYTCCCGC